MMTYHFARSVLIIATMTVAAGCAQRQTHPHAPSQAANTAPSLVLAQHVAQVDTEAYEPMIVEHPGGILFVAGQGGLWPSDSEYYANRAYWDSLWRARLWKSRDHGATWLPVDIGRSAAGALGNSDVDLAVAPDGTLYYVSMKWVDTVGEGRRIAIGVSHDIGATWSWTVLSEHRFDDRPWVAVAPDGAAHVVWNDGKGVQHVVSHNGGITWSQPTLVHDHVGSSHLAVGPHGEVAVRLIPWSASHNFFNPGVDLIAVSADAGNSWQTRPAPGERDWGTWLTTAVHSSGDDGVQAFTGNKANRRCCSGMVIPRWIEPLAWDGKGRLYSLWTDTTGVWLARSANRGATWDTWRIFKSRAPCYYPYLIARGDGELAATWHSGKGDSLRWQAARITVGHSTAIPRVVQSSLLELETFDADSSHPGGLRRVPAGEYLGVTFLRDGGIGVVTPLQVPFTRRLGFAYWRFNSVLSWLGTH